MVTTANEGGPLVPEMDVSRTVVLPCSISYVLVLVWSEKRKRLGPDMGSSRQKTPSFQLKAASPLELTVVSASIWTLIAKDYTYIFPPTTHWEANSPVLPRIVQLYRPINLLDWGNRYAGSHGSTVVQAKHNDITVLTVIERGKCDRLG